MLCWLLHHVTVPVPPHQCCGAVPVLCTGEVFCNRKYKFPGPPTTLVSFPRMGKEPQSLGEACKASSSWPSFGSSRYVWERAASSHENCPAAPVLMPLQFCPPYRAANHSTSQLLSPSLTFSFFFPANEPFVLALVNTQSRQGRRQQQAHPTHLTSPAQEPTVPGAQRDVGGMKPGKELHPPWVLPAPIPWLQGASMGLILRFLAMTVTSLIIRQE